MKEYKNLDFSQKFLLIVWAIWLFLAISYHELNVLELNVLELNVLEFFKFYIEFQVFSKLFFDWGKWHYNWNWMKKKLGNEICF